MYSVGLDAGFAAWLDMARASVHIAVPNSLCKFIRFDDIYLLYDY
jgi:hypothetical protein